MEYMPVVIDAKYISNYKIKITFDNGEEKVVLTAKNRPP